MAEPDEREQRSYCRICPVQCGVIVTTRDEQVLRVRGDPDHPRTRGYTCVKGRALPAFHHDPSRLNHPVLEGSEVSWDKMIGDLASRIEAIRETYGPDAVACYHGTWSWLDALGRRAAERYFRDLRTRSIYSALTVDAVARSYVAELMGGSSALIPNLDPETAGLTLLIGTNPVVSHGHASAIADPVRVLRDIASRSGLWVLDPRRTESARLATRHLAVRPGSDYVILGHVVRELLRRGAVDADYLARHGHGADELRAAVEPFDRELAAQRSGIDASAVDELVEAVAAARRIAVLTGTGTTMSPQGNATEWMAWALQIVTGSFEREGGLWFNPGWFMRLDQGRAPRGDGSARSGPASRPDLGRRFGEQPCAGLADEIEAGNVRALFVLGGNPLTSLPETPRLKAAIKRLDVLAVADVVTTPTVDLATHVLPVAGQLERADTTYYVELFLGEVAAQHTAAIVCPAFDRKPMWWVFEALLQRLRGEPASNASYKVREIELIEELASRVGPHGPGLTGDVYRCGRELRPRGWVSDGVLPGGRWQLAPAPLVAQLASLAEPERRGLTLIPRRVPRRMNSAVGEAVAIAPRPSDTATLVHPDDAASAGLRDGQRVRLVSATGELVTEICVTDDIVPGVVSMPHGLFERNVSELTSGRLGAVDDLTGMVYQSGLMVTLASGSD